VGIEHTGLVAGNPVIHRWLLETLRSGEVSPHSHGGHGGHRDR
jgi:hypothetical protein